MYTPFLRVKRNGVPILKKTEIDVIGERFVKDFQPDVLTNPSPVDIEGFIEFYLGMTPDFQYLSHNGVYLGMTVFNDTNKVPVYDPATNRAEYISAKARTVIIDNRLLDENQRHRFRFTLGHEGGHDIFHSGYFSYNPDQTSLFDEEFVAPMIQCRVDSGMTDRADTRKWDDHDWMEWQANHLSAAVLMPKSAVDLVVRPFVDKLKNPASHALLVANLSNCFDVSIQAATNRLKDLGYIKSNDKTDYSYASAIMDFADIAEA